MPLIADNVIVFLFWVIVRAFFRARSQNWSKTEAVIKTVVASEHTLYPYAEIGYAYKVNLERYSGKYKKGFWYPDSAHRFARRFTPSEHLTIRADPGNPERSYLFEEDQSWWKGWA